MSQYENYDKTAQNYDKARSPVGVEIIRETFRRSATPLKEQCILDAGCGTGNYTLAIIEDVAKIISLDGNEAMLKHAETKLKASRYDNYELKQGTLPALPLTDESVDGIMINQVIHHLDVEEDYPVLRQLCEEANRVLKTGGHLIINTCSDVQLREGYWYYQFIPTAVGKSVKRYPSVDLLMSMLSDCRFTDPRQTVPIEELFFGESYFDLEGPHKSEWRDCDSSWALLSPAELEKALEDCSRARSAGELPDLLERSERRRKQIGQTVFISARKASKA